MRKLKLTQSGFKIDNRLILSKWVVLAHGLRTHTHSHTTISFTLITRLGSGSVYNYLLIIRVTQLNLSKWWNDAAATMTIVREIVFYI